MKLVIVESPAKSKTIGHYLGEDYTVEASVGHIRDLATTGKGGLGVDVDHDFKPTYIINKDKTEVVKKLKKLAKKADEVILATDPDREGEAIAYHLATVLKLPIETTKRLEFHEITKDSITEAIKNPRTIDMNLVHSQETRRIIDRIIGFKISSLIKNRIASKSAGRVQSVTLKLICDHDKEIKEFVPVEYWKVNPIINAFGDDIELELYKLNGDKVELGSAEEADAILEKLSKTAKIDSINKITKKISAQPPFRTSTLQQEAFNKYNFKTRETTSLAQRLYEGIEVDGEMVGLITYMRTDSTKLSDTFIEKAKKYIIENYGEEYYKGVQAKATRKVNMSQDAHEAIRPTSLKRTPASIKKYLTSSEYKLYKLIYERTVGSLMSEKVNECYQIIFKSNDILLKYDQSKTVFKGYEILQKEPKDKPKFYDFEVGQEYEFKDVNKTQNFTKAPARYSEGRVVKLMEDEGIGRPSTYSSTILTLIQRKYVVSEKGILSPTEQGIKTSGVLTKYFPDLMNTEYTAEMENNLDLISEGETDKLHILNEFYHPFIEHYAVVQKTMYKDEPVYTGELCPICGNKLVVKRGRYGEFVACSNYPECTYIKKEEKEKPEEVGKLCPNCGAPLVYRHNKKGDKFIACSAFPKCHYVESVDQEPTEIRYCPECGATLVKRRSKKGYFYGCSNYPKCKHMEPIDKKDE